MTRELPQTVAGAGLPATVSIYEVGARDGLQNEKTVVPVEVKAEFLDRLAGTGLRTLEATSFVHPKWVPQLADAADLLARLTRAPGVDYPVLVPNERGLDRALVGCVLRGDFFGHHGVVSVNAFGATNVGELHVGVHDCLSVHE